MNNDIDMKLNKILFIERLYTRSDHLEKLLIINN